MEVLQRFHSDHNPLLLRCGGTPQPRGPRLFRFEATWIDHNDYQSVVEGAWRGGNGCPIPGHQLVKDASISFNKKVFGNIFCREKTQENRIRGVQQRLESVDSIRLLMLEQKLQQEYDQVLFEQELHWFQNSKEKWVLFGDRNTKYFHAQTMIRRKRNRIHGLHLPNGEWCMDEHILQDEDQKNFKHLFCAHSNTNMPPFVVQQVPRLSDEMAQRLSQLVTMEEVEGALNYMHPYKYLGPDGFQGVFFKFSLISQAFSSRSFDPIIVETLIALIPKVDSPSNFKEFRPISLCNTLDKLITKVLVNRLRPMLDSIISLLQSSFIPKRGTSDNVIILQEISHMMHKSKKKGEMWLLKSIYKKRMTMSSGTT